MMSNTHTPVLLEEAISALHIKPHGIYVDATFGRGGHSEAILKALDTDGRVIAFDRDSDAVTYAEQRFKDEHRLTIVHASFTLLAETIASLNLTGKVDGVLIDCGVSSPQLDDATRGFSFMKTGPLDMRMDRNQALTANAWINSVSEQDMVSAFKAFGEERYAKRIARAIVAERTQSKITTTTQLADIVAKAHPAWEPHKHPATRVFQAIRIVINQEFDALESCLNQALSVLAEGGRLAVISFHSLEDKIVKQFIQKNARADTLPIDLPMATAHLKPHLKKIGKFIAPSANECQKNPRARSARLRVVEKLV